MESDMLHVHGYTLQAHVHGCVIAALAKSISPLANANKTHVGLIETS